MIQRRDTSGHLRKVTRYRLRYRDQDGKWHSETKERLVDVERRKAEIELQLADGAWRDPRRGLIKLPRLDRGVDPQPPRSASYNPCPPERDE